MVSFDTSGMKIIATKRENIQFSVCERVRVRVYIITAVIVADFWRKFFAVGQGLVEEGSAVLDDSSLHSQTHAQKGNPRLPSKGDRSHFPL